MPIPPTVLKALSALAIEILLLAVASGSQRWLRQALKKLIFLFMCPHVALKSNAGCADSATHGASEVDCVRCRWLLWWNCFPFYPFSSAVATHSFSKALIAPCTDLLHCILSWAVDSHLSMSMLQTVRERFRVSLKRFLCPPTSREPSFNSP